MIIFQCRGWPGDDSDIGHCYIDSSFLSDFSIPGPPGVYNRPAMSSGAAAAQGALRQSTQRAHGEPRIFNLSLPRIQLGKQLRN